MNEMTLDEQFDALAIELDELLGSDTLFSSSNPAISGWTVGQQLWHTVSVLEFIAEIVHRIEAGEFGQEDGEPNAFGRRVFSTGNIARGRGVSPDPFQPAEALSRAELSDHLAGVMVTWRSILARTDRLRHVTGVYPHFVLGDFSASEWVHFALIHTEHHLRIIREILQEPSDMNGAT